LCYGSEYWGRPKAIPTIKIDDLFVSVTPNTIKYPLSGLANVSCSETLKWSQQEAK
jgi:hypothetical protein